MKNHVLKLWAIGIIFQFGCSPRSITPTEPLQPAQANPQQSTAASTVVSNTAAQAEVLSISVGGEPNNYQFSVEIQSPDTGCELYADWWEVIDEDGNLIYRRILLHSHPNEQPFIRSGGPVPVQASTMIIIRAHMHPGGYGNAALIGSILDGFEPVTLANDFATNLETTPPLPDECAF